MDALKSTETGNKLLMVTHNLNCEGASLFFFNLAKELKKLNYSIEILSPLKGPLSIFFLEEGIKVKIRNFVSNKKNSLDLDEYDVVLVNTIIGYKFIKKINLSRNKVLWCLHESERDFYFDYFQDLSEDLFFKVKKVVLSSKASFEIYDDLNLNNNFTIINTVSDYRNIYKYIKENSKRKIKEKYGFRKTDFLVNLIGTICLRKGQLEFTEAAISIFKKINNPNLKFIMVGGGRGYEYEKTIRKLINYHNLGDRIAIFGETKEIFDFYYISDIFVCNSYIEAFPMVTLEAMAFGLPIVSTDAYGLAEQIEDKKSGLLVMPGDTKDLEKKILFLIKNPNVARKLGINARKRLEKAFPFQGMIKKYNSLIREVINKK